VYVLTKKLSPPRAARFNDFMIPPSALLCSNTPDDIDIIAPDSTRTGSLGAKVSRATPNAGPCRMLISM
jgi:hypothetical protein